MKMFVMSACRILQTLILKRAGFYSGPTLHFVKIPIFVFSMPKHGIRYLVHDNLHKISVYLYLCRSIFDVIQGSSVKRE